MFAPLLFFGGIVGRLFTEFALTLSIAVLISMVVSLTTTPMMCALILPRERRDPSTGGSIGRPSACFDAMLAFYRSTLRVALRHPGAVALSLLATVGLNYYMFRYQMSYGLFPVQDTGLIIGAIQGDQSISFQAMKTKFAQLQTIVQDDPGGRQRRRLHRRPGDQYRLRLCLAEALRRTQAHRRRGRGAAARQAGRGRGRAAVHVRGLGSEHRRAAEQRGLSIHAALRRPDGALRMGAEAHRRR